MGSDTDSLIVEGTGAVSFISFDLAADILTPEALRQIAAASSRMLVYTGAPKVKIPKGQARSIKEILKLYEALRKDSGSLE